MFDYKVQHYKVNTGESTLRGKRPSITSNNKKRRPNEPGRRSGTTLQCEEDTADNSERGRRAEDKPRRALIDGPIAEAVYVGQKTTSERFTIVVNIGCIGNCLRTTNCWIEVSLGVAAERKDKE